MSVINVERHGAMVWEEEQMDALRKERCLCLRCAKCKPGTPEHCAVAARLYEACKEHNLALMVTRCATWIER